MTISVEEASRILRFDLDPEFVLALAIRIGWSYLELFDELNADLTLNDDVREEFFNRARGDRVMRAISDVCKRHGVPFEFRQLIANGQNKMLVKAGRIVLIQEPIYSISDHPHAAVYKRDLAELHGFVRQLELNLGDQPHRISDWSGTVFAVLLHGSAGLGFSRTKKALGSIMLALPDAAYQQWMFRLDLQTIAMYGHGEHYPDRMMTDTKDLYQDDKVVVRPKRRNTTKDTA